MSSNADTLNISPLRRTPTLPIAQVQLEESVNHPKAAEMARARIAAISDLHPLPNPEAVPAVPTAELILDRDVLARQLGAVPAVQRPPLPPIAKSALLAAGAFAIVLLLFKAPVIFSQVGYLTGKPTPTPAASQAPSAIIPAAPSITIPKINVGAPVVYEPSVAEAAVQKALEGGIVHYGTTPEPGRPGNAVFFGHSSNDWWEPGNYKFVFVLLDKLAPGDQLTLDYQSKRYTYEVTGSRVVLPTDLSVLTPTTEPTITLITCTPPGTSWKRLIVTAKQIDPDPAQATAKPASQTGSEAGSNLPSAAPALLDQLGQAWEGLVHGVSSLFGADKAKDSDAGQPTSPAQLPAVK